MKYAIKNFGLILVAVIAIGATTATPALAGELHLGTQPAVVTAHSNPNQQHTLTLHTTVGTLYAKCPTASSEGTTVGLAISELTVTPTYGPECKLFGVAATFQPNGCKYTLTGAGQPAGSFNKDIVSCTAGKKMEIKSAICNITIGEQNGLSHVVFENVAGSTPKEVDVNSTVSGITTTQDGAGCPDGNGFTAANASFSGSTRAKGYVDAGTGQATKHGHQYTEHKCGNRVDLFTT